MTVKLLSSCAQAQPARVDSFSAKTLAQNFDLFYPPREQRFLQTRLESHEAAEIWCPPYMDLHDRDSITSLRNNLARNSDPFFALRERIRSPVGGSGACSL